MLVNRSALLYEAGPDFQWQANWDLSLSLFGLGSSSDLVLRVIEPESGQYLLVSTSDNDIITIKVQFVFDEEFITLHDIFVSLLPLTTSTMLIKALK